MWIWGGCTRPSAFLPHPTQHQLIGPGPGPSSTPHCNATTMPPTHPSCCAALALPMTPPWSSPPRRITCCLWPHEWPCTPRVSGPLDCCSHVDCFGERRLGAVWGQGNEQYQSHAATCSLGTWWPKTHPPALTLLPAPPCPALPCHRPFCHLLLLQV